ncbi:MAG TPA: ABC transporter substrate-binding protein, partial [Candidatus Binatus sp.]|nr:ABC transporter substrate-binding protein [Candidatus Binatus sp.]
MARLFFTALAGAALIISTAVAGGAAALENIKVSYAVLSAAYMDHVTAMEKGFFRDEGLNVEVLRMGGGVATPALLSGQLHFSSSAGSSLSAAVRGGPLKI